MPVQLLVNKRFSGVAYAAGAQLTLSPGLEADLVYQREAVYVGDDPRVGNTALAGLVFSADFVDGLYSSAGPHVEFLRSTGGSGLSHVTDWAGYVRECKSGEALIWGARRVENLLRYTEHLTYTGTDGWSAVNGATVSVPNLTSRTGPDGEQSAWIVTRDAQANSVLRTARSLRRHGRLAGSDLLLPVSHIGGCSLRQISGGTGTAEIRVHSPGGSTLATQVVNLSTTWQRFGILFTPAAPKRISGLSWSSNVLTVTSNAHGLASGSTVRISGCQPNTFDGEYTITGITTNTFTVALTGDPGSATYYGWLQQGYAFSIAPTSWASTSAGSIEVAMPFVSDRLGYGTNIVPEYVSQDGVLRGRYYHGANVDGVRYFSRQPADVLTPATGLIAASLGDEITTIAGVATYPESTNQITSSEDFSGWTATNVSLSADTAVTGMPNATVLDEGTNAGTHRITIPGSVLSTANLGSGSVGYLAHASVYAAKPSGGQDHLYLELVDKAGATQRAWFNLATGVTGDVSVGTAHMEGPLANGEWRCLWCVPVGVGGSECVLRIGMAAVAGTTSYTGANKTIRIFGASFVGAQTINSSVQQRPVPVPYARNDSTARVQPGAVAWLGCDGLVGKSDIAAYCESTPYFAWSQGDKVTYTAVLYFRTASPQQTFQQSSTAVGTYDWDRFGITVRPNNQPTSEHKGKFGCDLYNGEVTQYYLWSAAKVVREGQWIVPSDTQPDNLNSKGMFVATRVTGPTGASEPSWPGSLNGSVVDGGVTWVRSNDNGISGNWEPYNGAQITPPAGFMARTKCGVFIGDNTDYGYFVNGIEAPKQTQPQPVSPVWGTTMRYSVKAMYFGTLGTNQGLNLSALQTTYQSSSGIGLMGIHTQFHRRARLWSRVSRAREMLLELTAA